jgi:hypothetical protein
VLPTELGPVLYEVVDGRAHIYTDDVAAEQANQQAQDTVARHLQISSDAVLIDRRLWEGPSGPSVVYSQYQVLVSLRQSEETAPLLDAAEQALERLDVRELAALLEHIDGLAREYFTHAVTAWNEFKVSKTRDHADEAAAKLDMARCYAADVVETILQVLDQAQLEQVLERFGGDHSLTLFDVYRMTHDQQQVDQFFKTVSPSEQDTLMACLEMIRTLESSKNRRLEVLTINNTSFFDMLEGMDQAGLGDVIERSQAHALLAADFFDTNTLTGTQLSVLAIIEHATRRIRILSATPTPHRSPDHPEGQKSGHGPAGGQRHHEVPDPRPGQQVHRRLRCRSCRQRHHHDHDWDPRTADERNHGTLDPNLPSRTARPHPHPEPGPPAARPARIRRVLSRPPDTPRPAGRSSPSPTPPTDHRIRPTGSPHHPTT